MLEQFADRRSGGRALAARLSWVKARKDAVVLALPRGGVPVAFEIARKLNAPLDVFLVRKLGVPGQEELAFGAIASGGVTVFNKSVLRFLELSDEELKAIIEREQKELERREKLYRGNRPPLDLTGKICILVDDGLATGATMTAALDAVRAHRPQQIIIAAPVACESVCRTLAKLPGERCVCVMQPEPFDAVGKWYEDFEQTTDEEVLELLARAVNDSRANQTAA